MKYKIILLLFMLWGEKLWPQNLDVHKEINAIDSLITYKQLDSAEKKANIFSKFLNEKYDGNQYLEERVSVHLLQGLVKDRQYQHNKALQLFLDVLNEAEENNLYKIACRAKIYIGLSYEHAGNTDLAFRYLQEARKMCEAYRFKDLYSTLYIRYAQMHRYFGFDENSRLSDLGKRMEKLGLFAGKDSAFYYAAAAMAYAKKYNNENDLNDGYVVMGILNAMTGKHTESSAWYLKSLAHWRKTNNFETVANMYNAVVSNYIEAGKFKEALKYSDSALPYYKNMFVYHKYKISKRRSIIYKELEIMDSAYYYLNLAYEDNERFHNEAELSTTRDLEEKYQNDKKEAALQSKNRQMLLIGSLLAVIVIASVILFFQNRKIKSRNMIINRQLGELSKTLDQKQVLLSELQHRVKNNLQHVISILEIQKESVSFNNIEELIRGNQNRIYSMALLHRKLNVADVVNEVDLEKYITELASLVKDSYEDHKKKIQMDVTCQISTISIQTALPLGLIIVELVSNSIKHAFKRVAGTIVIDITKDRLHYADNGKGFDFNATPKKGLGIEIIKGLIDQLNGTVETGNSAGFELTVYF